MIRLCKNIINLIKNQLYLPEKSSLGNHRLMKQYWTFSTDIVKN